MPSEPLFLPHDTPPSSLWPLNSQSESQAPPGQAMGSLGLSGLRAISQAMSIESQHSPYTQAPRRPLKMKRHQSTLEESEERSIKRSTTEEDTGDRDVVGVLLGDIEGMGRTRILIKLDQIVLIGRSPENDVALDYTTVSRRHLRFTPVRTSTRLTIVSLSDLSTYGFYLNDVFHRPDRIAKVDDKRFRCKTYILNERDRIRLPGCPTVFTFYQGPAHSVEVTDRVAVSLFENPKPYSTYQLGNLWLVHNCQLGDGSFGVVNLASHRNAAWFQVACKTVKIEEAEDRRRHYAEVTMLKRMSHPNVNGIIDIQNEFALKRSHLILELMTGGDLFAYQEKHGALTEREVKWLAWQLVSGLNYLHSHDVAHRDLKLENILLAVSAIYPRVVICDFGHAISYGDVLELTPKTEWEEGVRQLPQIGTASYIPPERLKAWLRPPQKLRGLAEDLPAIRAKDGQKAVSRRERLARKWFIEETNIDSWSLGVTLFIVATSHHPYDTSFHGEDDPTASTRPHSLRQLSGAQSWAQFRAVVGEGSTLGGSYAKGPDGDRARRLLDGCKGENFWWFRGVRWQDFSEDSTDFLQKLLEPLPLKRLQIALAKDHKWFQTDKKLLDVLWERVVENGDVLHPDTVAALLEDIVRSEQGTPERSVSPDDSIQEPQFRLRERPRLETIEEIEDPPESAMETREEIETAETGSMMDESWR